jgi:hypothetical protein
MPKQKYNYNVALEAETEAEAIQKMKAATSLIKHLSTRELTRLAEVVEKEPGKVKVAKSFLGLG